MFPHVYNSMYTVYVFFKVIHFLVDFNIFNYIYT